MKKYRVLKWSLCAFAVMASSVAYADVAPVESIPTQDMQQMPDANASVSDAQDPDTSAPQQANGTASAASPADNPANTEADQSASDDIADDAGGTRVVRLEQQMSNITQMNLPQQIDEMRQEIQQLNGRLQVQQHELQVLSNQQRSFYQDLNRRVQQLIGSGNVSLSAAKSGPQAKKNTTASDANMGDSNAYRAAFDLLVKKQYPDAIQRFKAYIDNYPKGAFIANAYYWLGEIYLKQNDMVNAQKSFDTVVSKYAKSNKVPDAKLKLAIIRINLGEKDEARRQLQAIKQQYPGSTAAQLASIQLQRMQ